MVKLPSYQRKPYENVERGFYIIGNRRLHFKSKMEANYALYLEFLKNRKEILDWQYEPQTFVFEKILFGTRSYKPDFLVVRNNGNKEWHETKGYFDKRSRTKIKRMGIYFPNEKIIVIGKDEYRALSKWRRLLQWY